MGSGACSGGLMVRCFCPWAGGLLLRDGRVLFGWDKRGMCRSLLAFGWGGRNRCVAIGKSCFGGQMRGGSMWSGGGCWVRKRGFLRLSMREGLAEAARVYGPCPTALVFWQMDGWARLG